MTGICLPEQIHKFKNLFPLNRREAFLLCGFMSHKENVKTIYVQKEQNNIEVTIKTSLICVKVCNVAY